MDTKEYNGWTNYETWLVALWVDNDEGTYLHVRELAKEALEADPESEVLSRDQEVRYRLEETYKDFVEGMVYGEEPPASIATDLLGAALAEVNWREIVEHLLDEVREEATP